MDGQTHLLKGASRAKVAPSSRTNFVLFDRCLPLAVLTLVALTRNKASNDQGAVQTLFEGIVTLRLGRRPFPGNSNQVCTIGNTNRESKANNSDISLAWRYNMASKYLSAQRVRRQRAVKLRACAHTILSRPVFDSFERDGPHARSTRLAPAYLIWFHFRTVLVVKWPAPQASNLPIQTPVRKCSVFVGGQPRRFQKSSHHMPETSHN